VIKKAEFTRPQLESASSSVNVSSIPKDAFDQFLTEFGKKFETSQKITQDILQDLSDRMEKIDKGKSVDTAYSTKDLTPNSAAPASIIEIEYGMPPNYFAGQTPPLGPNRPDRSHQPVRPVPQQQEWSDRSIQPVRSVPWCWPQHPLLHFLQFHVWLPLAKQLMNWRALYRRTPLNRTASHLFHPP